MKRILLYLRGVLLGTALLLPGVSSGSLFLSCGAAGQLLRFSPRAAHRRGALLRAVLVFLLGVLCGVVLCALVQKPLLSQCPFVLCMLYIGFMAGGIPRIGQQVRWQGIGAKHILMFALCALLGLSSTLPETLSAVSHNLSPSPQHALLMFFVGLGTALCMLLPGISGNVLLLVSGYYDAFSERLGSVALLFHWANRAALAESLTLLLPFFLGLGLGVWLLLHLLRMVRRIPLLVYYGVLGLLAVSPAAVLVYFPVDYAALSIPQLLLGLLCLPAAFLLVYLVNRQEFSQQKTARSLGTDGKHTP